MSEHPVEVDFCRAVFTVPEACAYLKISRALFYKLVAADKLHTFHVGTRALILGAELDRFVQSAHAA